jgi:hypothetical protein
MAEQPEIDEYKTGLSNLEDEALPILEEIAKHTKRARKAMGGETTVVDTLTLSNELVELAILLQRLGDRISMMGYIVRGCKEFYERTREGHKTRLVKEGNPAGVADSMKIELSHEEFEVYNQCEYTMDRLVYARKSTDKTIDAIRSKLSYEKVNEQRA